MMKKETGHPDGGENAVHKDSNYRLAEKRAAAKLVFFNEPEVIKSYRMI